MPRVQGTSGSHTFSPFSLGATQDRPSAELSGIYAAEERNDGSTRAESTFLRRVLRAFLHKRPRHPALAELDVSETSPPYTLFCRDLKDEVQQITGLLEGESSLEQCSSTSSRQSKGRKRRGRKATRRTGSSMEVDGTPWSTVTLDQSYLHHVQCQKSAPPVTAHIAGQAEAAWRCQTDDISSPCHVACSPQRQYSIPSVRMRSPTSSSFAMSIDVASSQLTRRRSTQMSIDDIDVPPHPEQPNCAVNYASDFIPSLGQQAEILWRCDSGPSDLAPGLLVNTVDDTNLVGETPLPCTQNATLDQAVPSPSEHIEQPTDCSPALSHGNHQKWPHLPSGRTLLKKIPATIKDIFTRSNTLATAHSTDETQKAVPNERPAECSGPRSVQPVGTPLGLLETSLATEHIVPVMPRKLTTVNEPSRTESSPPQPRQDDEPPCLLLAPSSPPSEGISSKRVCHPPPIKRIPPPSTPGTKSGVKRRRSDSPEPSEGQSEEQCEELVHRYKRARRGRTLSYPEARRSDHVERPTPAPRLSPVADIIPLLPLPFEELPQRAGRPRQRRKGLAAEHRAQRAAGDYKVSSRNRPKARRPRASSEPPTSRSSLLEPLFPVPAESSRPLELPPAPEPPILTLEPRTENEPSVHYCDSPEQLAYADDELDDRGHSFYCLPNIHITPDDEERPARRPVHRAAGDDGPRSLSPHSSSSDDVDFILHNEVVTTRFLAPERDGRRTPDAFSVDRLLAALPRNPK